MTITGVGKKCNLTPDTLRYYERIGLIPPIMRTKGGIRDYSEDDYQWIDFIKCMRSAGMSVEVLIKYVSLFRQGKGTRETRKKILKEQRGILAERVVEIQQTLEKLDFKIANYDELVYEAEKKLSKQRYNNG